MIARFLIATLLWVALWPTGAARADNARFEPVPQALYYGEQQARDVTRSLGGVFKMKPGQRLLVPVRPGETLRVRGATMRTGLAFGSPPDMVAWEEGWETQHRVRIPPSLRADWLAVEVEEPGQVMVERLAHPHDALADKRFRQLARRWLKDPGRRAPAASSGAAARWLSLLTALPESADSRELSPWALTLLNELQLEAARVRVPWFHRTHESEHELSPEQSIQLPAEPGEVISLRTKVRAGEPSVLELWSGGQLLRRERWFGWERAGEDGWVDSFRITRAVARGDDLQLRIRSSHARVRVRRYRPTDTLDALWHRWFAGAPKSAKATLWTQLADGTLALPDALGKLPREQHALASVVSLLRAASAEEVRLYSTPALNNRRRGSEPYRMAALWYLARVGEKPAESVCERRRAAPNSPTHYAIDLAVDALCGSHTPGAPLATAAFDRLLSNAPDDPWLRDISRELQRTTVQPRRVALDELGDPIVEILPVPAATDDAQCRAVGRWRVLEPGEHTLTLPGDRPRVIKLRAVTERGARVRIDKFEVSVQGARELASRVRLLPGEHNFRVQDATVMVWLPGESKALCSSLRQTREWWPVTGASEVDLPTARSTFLELSVKPARANALTQPLVVRAGARRWELEPLGRPQRARVRLPLADITDRFALGEPYEPVLVQIAVRQVRRKHEVSEAKAAKPAPRAATLADLRKASQALHAATEATEQIAALRSRMHALRSLGQRQFAEFDRDRLQALGVSEEFPTTPRLGPLNLAARLPVLSPRELSAFTAARKADKLGELQRAARLYRSIPAPVAQRKAATLIAQTSSYADDPELALLAYALAVEAGEPVLEGRRVAPRLKRAVRWRSPAGVERTAGSHIERRDPASARFSQRDEVRRAMLDAPAGARLLREGETLRARTRLEQALSLRIEGQCRSFSGAPCQLEARVDGQRAALQSVVLQPGLRDLTLAPTRRGLAWFRVCPAQGPCSQQSQPLAFETRQRWYRADRNDPIVLTVGGPTVVRLSLRTPRSGTGVTVKTGDEVTHELTPASDEDGETRIEVPVFRASQRIEIRTQGVAHARFLVAYADKATQRSSRPASTRVRAAPLVSDLGLPEPVIPDGRSLRTAGPLSVFAGARWTFAEEGDLDPVAADAPYLTTQVRLLRWFSDYNLYSEAGLFARSRLSGGPQAFGAVGRVEWREEGWRPRLVLFGRITTQRFTPQTQFLGAAEPDSFVFGAQTRATLLWRYSMPNGLSILPGLAFTYRRTNEDLRLELPPGPDPLVFSDFASDHPVALIPALILYYRPLLDVSITARTSATTNAQLIAFGDERENFSYLDRVEQLLRLDVVAGHGFSPWAALEYRLSHRYRDLTRSSAITRHTLTGRAQSWLWIGGRYRLALAGQLGLLLDRRNGERQSRGWVGFVEFNWMWSRGRGVSDLPASETEFRTRMNEGAGLADSLDGSRTIAPTISVGD